ncbi:hypothetical protein AGMMS49938_04920 [Fibrobacterales bacterium]|nr:hypothetical protein AGMMS49938_04920 [Fibrobacterales bacterium]
MDEPPQISTLPAMLHYAETHFRFPVSRLYRKEPDILIDTPFQIDPNVECPVWLISRNTDCYPVYINEIFGEWKNEKDEKIVFKIPFQKKLTEHFHFEELKFAKPPAGSGFYLLQIFIKYEIGEKTKICERWNYPFLHPKPIVVNFLREPQPKPKNWVAGETHCHSNYTADSIEFGASPAVLQKAAKALGLDFVCITDHSYDLLNDVNFQKLKKDVAELNSANCDNTADKMPLLIAGEEISCGSHRRENVHLLAYNNEHYVEGHGDGGRRWWNTSPDLTVAEAAKKVGSACFAAHPKLEMMGVERLLLKRGHWHLDDILGIEGGGVEFWNGYRGRDFYEGRKLWIECLLRGHRILPWGGNDAHGDLNSYVALKKPLWSLKCNQEHIFGNVRTVLPNFPPTESNLYITDGPALHIEQVGNKCLLHAKSNADFGEFLSITLFKGERGKHFERTISFSDNNFEFSLDDCLYARAECETTFGKFAMTAAIYSPLA